jgi:hypothetical protein
MNHSERSNTKSMENVLPDASLMSWIEKAIGPFRVVSRYAHDHGYSQLWRLQADQDRRDFYWLKCHQYPGKWAGEVYALTQWIPSLNLAAPHVCASLSEPSVVLLTEVKGTAAGSVSLEQGDEEILWHAAGVYLARLHTLENDWLGAVNPDGTPQGEIHYDPANFVRHSIESRLKQGAAQNLFTAAEQEFIQQGATEGVAALAGDIPRAIHRDYSPRNWMTDTHGRLTAVIDFEHARWDVRAADLNRWWDTDFREKPRLAEVFFDGYLGGMPDEKLRAQIQALRLLGAAGGIVWAARVGDTSFGQTNRESLHRMMAVMPA